jgi:hypothetical protein
MIGAAVITLAQLADLVTARASHEINPFIALVLERPVLAFALKAAEVALILAVVVNADVRHRWLGSALIVMGTTAGVVGAISNVAASG